MVTFFIVLAAAAQAYLLGSVDTGILVSKYLYHDDVRNHGSGAAGMTNMLRTFGKKAAALTAFGDVLKGALAVCTISDHILRHEYCTAEERQNSFTQMMELALRTAVKLEK